MGKFIDMTGWIMKEHGILDSKWTVLEKSITRNKKIYWKCKCECGTVKDVVGADLRNGKSRCCGCITKENGSVHFINELGNRYGRLVVIARAINDNKNEAQWECQCNCGNKIITSGYLLRKGSTQSCGCLHNELLSQRVVNDLTNQRFGKLIAIEPVGRNAFQEVIWHCKCDCGNEKDIVASSLTKNKTKSCGCLSMSHGELKINEILNNNNIEFIQEYKPSAVDLFENARYDFYIPSFNTIIEFDGIQHFKPREFFNGEEGLIKTQAHDKEKNEWAHNHGITIIRIPYTHYDSLCLEDLLPESSSFILHKKIKYISHKRKEKEEK